MAVVSIRQGSDVHEISLNISEELVDYDWGYNARWTDEKLVAASPFRIDSTPSFFVNLETGGWADSGAVDDEYTKGGLVKLLAYLRHETQDETTEYLLGKYGRLYTDTEDIRLPEIHLATRSKRVVLSPETIVEAVSPYLTKRGISAEAQRLYGVGYNPMYKGFTALPWYSTEGHLANVKYRSTKDKRFFYEKKSTKIALILYGMTIIKKERRNMSVLVEGEIDALSWATAGIPAIACGGSSISDEQIDIIKRSSIRRLLVGGDNDPAGQRLNAEVIRKLSGHVELYRVDYGDCNDANDYLKAHGSEGLKRLAELSTKKLSEFVLQLSECTLKW